MLEVLSKRKHLIKVVLEYNLKFLLSSETKGNEFTWFCNVGTYTIKSHIIVRLVLYKPNEH